MIPRPLTVCLLALALAPPAIAAMNDHPAPDDPKPVDLAVTPKGEPAEVFRLRLLPREIDRTPGDAVPIYLRLGAGQQDPVLKLIDDKSTLYLDSPLADLPLAEARKFVDTYKVKLQQIDFAARRRTSDWNYTLPEQSADAINILLPDAQEMRTWSRLLAIKARVEVAEGKFDDAARTAPICGVQLRTGT